MKVLFSATVFALIAVVWCPLVLIPASNSARNVNGHAESDDLESLFNSLDTSHVGVLTLEEFLADPRSGRLDAEAEFRKMDTHNSGEVTLAEFV